MKRYISLLTLLLLTQLQLTAQQYDSKIIRENFANKNTEQYKIDTFKEITKQEVVNRFLSAKDIATHTIKCTDNILTDPSQFRCPQGRGGYTTTLLNANISKQTMQCLVAKDEYLDKPLGLFNWSLNDYTGYDNSCANILVENKKDAIAKNTEAIEKSKQDFDNLQAAKVSFSNRNEEVGANTSIPHLLVGTIIADNDLIDIQSSLNHNTLVLQDGFKMKGANYLRAKTVQTNTIENTNIGQAFDVPRDAVGGTVGWLKNLGRAVLAQASASTGVGDYNPQIQVLRLENIASEDADSADVIKHRLISMLEFYPKWSLLNQDIFIILGSIFGMVAIFMYSSTRVAQHLDEHKTDKNSQGLMFLLVVLFAFVVFAPSNTPKDVTIDEKQYKLTNSNFQNLERAGYYTTIDFANGIAKAVIDTEMNAIIRRTNHVTSSSLISTFSQNSVMQKEAQIYAFWLQKCGNYYDINFLNQFASRKNNYFPASEQWIYATATDMGRKTNYYSHVENGGSVLSDLKGKYPTLSLSFCHDVTNRYEYLSTRVNENNDLITKSQNGVDVKKLNFIENIVKSQYGMYEEWGFLSVLATPLINYKAQQMGVLFEEESKDRASQLLENERDNFAKEVAYNAPLLMIPGISNLYNIIKENSGKIGAAMGATAAGPAGSLAGGVVGFAGSSAIAYTVTITFVEELIKLIPIISITMFGLLIILKIIIKIFTYHLIAPFVIVVSFSKQNTQILSNFFSRVLSIMLEIPIFVLSIYAAMSAHDLLMSIGTPISSTLMKIMSEITLDHSAANYNILVNGLDHAMQGFIMILLHLFSFVIIYKILATYHSQIFEALEVKSAQAFDDIVEKMAQSSQSWGHRI